VETETSVAPPEDSDLLIGGSPALRTGCFTGASSVAIKTTGLKVAREPFPIPAGLARKGTIADGLVKDFSGILIIDCEVGIALEASGIDFLSTPPSCFSSSAVGVVNRGGIAAGLCSITFTIPWFRGSTALELAGDLSTMGSEGASTTDCPRHWSGAAQGMPANTIIANTTKQDSFLESSLFDFACKISA